MSSSLHSKIKLFLVAAVAVAGLIWIGGVQDVYAGGKGATVVTEYPVIVDCIPIWGTMEFCTTITGREHQVMTPSGNLNKTARMEERMELLDDGVVTSLISKAVVRESRLDKGGSTHTLRSNVWTTTPSLECHTTIRITNGGPEIVENECVPI